MTHGIVISNSNVNLPKTRGVFMEYDFGIVRPDGHFAWVGQFDVHPNGEVLWYEMNTNVTVSDDLGVPFFDY